VATLARDVDAGFETARLLACPECDLLLHGQAGVARGEVACPRCGATLFRRFPWALDATLALMIAAAVLFAVANVYPIMSLELQGRENAGTLLGMAKALHEEGVTSAALLVVATVVVMPGLEILAMLYLLVPLRLGRAPEGLAIVSKMLFAVRPWVMAEVFTLAALVSIGRLGNFAELELGAGFWAMGAVMFLFAATDTIFDEHTLWECAAAIRESGGR